MLNFPGIVLGTWVLNNLTYPFFLLSKDLLYRTWQVSCSTWFYCVLILRVKPRASNLLSLLQRHHWSSPLSLIPCSYRSSCLQLGANWTTTENANSNGVGDAALQDPWLSTVREGHKSGHFEPWRRSRPKTSEHMGSSSWPGFPGRILSSQSGSFQAVLGHGLSSSCILGSSVGPVPGAGS